MTHLAHHPPRNLSASAPQCEQSMSGRVIPAQSRQMQLGGALRADAEGAHQVDRAQPAKEELGPD